MSPLCAMIHSTKFGWNWSNGTAWRKGFLNFINVFLLFHDNLPLEKKVALHLNKLEFHSPRNAICQVCLKLFSCALRVKIFKIFVNVFSLIVFLDYLPWRRVGPFCWTNFNFLYLRMLCAKFGWKYWPCGSGEEVF